MSQSNSSLNSSLNSTAGPSQRPKLRTTALSVASVLLPALLPALFSAHAGAFDLNEAMLNTDQAFSATQTITTGKRARDSFTTELYREGKKMRMDITEGDQQMSIVMRFDNETNFMLMHELKMYQEVKGKRVKQYQTNLGAEFSNQQKLGRESVNGYDTTKYTADYKDNDGQTGTGTYWVTDDDIVVRSQMQFQRRRKVQETTINLTNLKVSDQPDELFELPAGYNSLGLGSMFSNAMRQSNQPASNGPVSDQERAQNEAEAGNEASEAAPEPEENRGKRARKALGKLFGGGQR